MRLLYEYANLYRTGLQDALAGAINNSVTSIVVKDASKFYVSCIFSVDSEHFKVTAVTLSTNTLTVATRGTINGTSAASHADLAATTILGLALADIGSSTPTPDYFICEKRNCAAQFAVLEGNWYAQAGGDASNNVVLQAKGFARNETGAPVTLWATTLPGQAFDLAGYGSPAVAGSNNKQIMGASPAAAGRFYAQFIRPAVNYGSTTGLAVGLIDPKILVGVQRTAGAPFTAGVLVLDRLSLYTLADMPGG